MKVQSNKGSYAHPVLQEGRDTYQNHIEFYVFYNDIIDSDNKINIPYEISLSSKYMKNLMSDGKCEIIFHIEHKNYRFIDKISSMNGDIVLKKEDFSPEYHIQILPLIVVKKEIRFMNPTDETNKFYQKILWWDLVPGSVLAIGEPLQISINQLKGSFSSVIKLYQQDDLGIPFKITLNDIIRIYISPKFNDKFSKVRETSKMANFYLLNQAIFRALVELFKDREEFESSKLWVNWIVDKLSQYNVDVEDIIETADYINLAEKYTNLLLNDKLFEAFEDEIKLITRRRSN